MSILAIDTYSMEEQMRRFLPAVLATALLSTMLIAESVTLQEGLDGYSGTHDTYLYNREQNSGHGGKQQLNVIDCPN